jgi:glycosyltransferase involved in cell wall biosynthesis
MMTEMAEIMPGTELSIVIPFYNEAANVQFVLEGLIKVFKDTGIRLEIIPVNNGSEDETAEIIRDCSRNRDNICTIYPIDIKKNRGLGWGLRQGFARAKGTYIGYLGGDGQTSPLDVLNMYRILSLHTEKDMITGRRIHREDGFKRLLISRVFNFCFRALYRTHLQDINGTPKIFKAEHIQNFDWKSDGWFIDAELILRFLKKKLEIIECPVWFSKRNGGHSHIDAGAIFEFIRNMTYFFFMGRNLQ